jgi:four helix bundle protein
MAAIKQFEDLNVWQDARQLVAAVYAASKAGAFSQDFGLRDQIRRAAVSTMSNIAEGFERGTRNEFVHFLTIAKGSNGEVRSQLQVALDQKYIGAGDFASLRDSSVSLSKKLSAFIRYLEGCTSNSRIKKPAKTARVMADPQPATCNLQPATSLRK